MAIGGIVSIENLSGFFVQYQFKRNIRLVLSIVIPLTVFSMITFSANKAKFLLDLNSDLSTTMLLFTSRNLRWYIYLLKEMYKLDSNKC